MSAMKDQNTITNEETKTEKFNHALDLYIESVQKPNNVLRSCAHNQNSFDELMEIRNDVLEYVKTKRK